MGGCRLLLLGPPLFKRDDRAAPIRLRKALALAAYLAVEQRSFSREFLATLLWPDLGQQSALANVRRMLTHLRDIMGEHCIRTDGDLVQLDPVLVDVDILEFQSLPDGPPLDSGFGHLEAAVGLYRGSFLEGFTLGDCLEFDEWQDGVRRRMEGAFDELLETLCREYLRAGRAKSALPFARRWLELDRLNETAHRMLMEIHARMGRADLARKQFDSCTRTFSQEGLEPEEQTRELLEAIAARRLGPGSAYPTGLGGEPEHSQPGSSKSPARVPIRPLRTGDRAPGASW